MKDLNKLLADFVGEKVVWDIEQEEWRLDNYLTVWQPDSDWNQLMQVIKKMRENPIIGDIITSDFKYYLTKADIEGVYREVIINMKRLELMSNESTFNSK